MATATPGTTAAQEWREGWRLVFASSIGFSFFAVLLGATGLFMGPLSEEFGWNRTLLSSGPAIASFVTAVLSPFYGALIDRFGTRRLALPGIVLTTGAICTFGLLSGAPVQWVALWLMFGLFSTMIKSTVWTTAVAGVFEKGRGLALGFVMAGTALSQTLVPIIGNALIEVTGWRSAFVWLGLGWGAVTFLVCWLFLYDVHDRIKARARASGAPQDASTHVDLPGMSIAEAWRSSALWRVAASTFIVMVLTIGLGVHLFPILTESGVSRANAAWLTALGGVAGIVGKLATGVLIDRYRPNWVGGLTLAAAGLTFFMLVDGIRSLPLIIVAMLVNGYTAGCKMQICGFLTVGYSGMRNFGKIYGVVAGLIALASASGPVVAGAVYDLSGGYGMFLLLGGIGSLVGAAIMVSLPGFPKWDAKAEPA
jgi:predicted MFS family arabinose efflux permease